jgi:Tfp pilus assembly protein FimT
VIVAIVVATIVCLLAGPYLFRLWRRERLRVAAQEVFTLVVAARLKAVKLNQQVVLWINPSTRLIVAWPDAAPLNFVQDPGEPTVLHLRLRLGVYFQSPNGDELNGSDSVAFDTYGGNPEIVDRVVFRPDGTLVIPQGSNSRAPMRPAARTATVPFGSLNCNPGNTCRGIYISDRSRASPEDNPNTFRVSVSDFGPTGRVSLLKWLPPSEGGNPGENNYVPPPWKWVD